MKRNEVAAGLMRDVIIKRITKDIRVQADI